MHLHQLVALQVGKLHQLGVNEVSLSAAELWAIRTGLDNRKMHYRSSYIQGLYYRTLVLTHKSHTFTSEEIRTLDTPLLPQQVILFRKRAALRKEVEW